MEYRIATKNDIDTLLSIRLDMLRIVNGLSDQYNFSESFIESCKRYFVDGDQTTALAFEKGKCIACASMSYIEIMPTFSHQTGKRAHLMNVYTNTEYRRQGIASKLVKMLIADAKEKKVTEISLDTTNAGRPLYQSLGFRPSDECMVMNLG